LRKFSADFRGREKLLFLFSSEVTKKSGYRLFGVRIRYGMAVEGWWEGFICSFPEHGDVSTDLLVGKKTMVYF
jgi:hypothetical protein